MKIGLFPATGAAEQTPAFLKELGPAAEAAGFHSLWAPEHVVLFDDYDSQPAYTEHRTLRGAEGTGMLDCFAVLTFLATCTDRIRLGTGIAVLPQRNPVMTAKQASSLDVLSGGRFDLGVGVGWVKEEYEALGATHFAHRGAQADSYLAVMRTLWEDVVSEHHDAQYSLEPCYLYPKPLQSPLPVHIGGNSPAALRRVARFAQGWYAFNLSPDQLAENLARLDCLLEQEGRARADVEVHVCGYGDPVGPAQVEAYGRAGADQVILFGLGLQTGSVAARLDELTDGLAPYLTTAVPA